MENKDGTPMPPGWKPEEGSAPVDAPVIEKAPEGAKEVKVEVKSEGGFFQKAWAKLMAASDAVWDGVAWVVKKTASFIGVAWSYTGSPLFDFIERWVPGMGRIRSAARWYALYTVIIGAVIVGTLVGTSFISTVYWMGVGAVLLPWIMLTTPALWGAIAIDLCTISVFMILINAILWKAAAGESFWANLAHGMWPGMYETVASWLANRKAEKEAAVAPEAVLAAA